MKEFDVQICVIDAQPNTNEAQEFARYFPGRVYLGWYQEGGVDMVKWLDKARPKEAIRKGGQEIKIKWQVHLQRYQIIDYTLRQFQEGMIKLPTPGKLLWLARNTETGRMENLEIVKEFFFSHLKSMVREKKDLDQIDDKGGKVGRFKMQYKYIGSSDPHFTHAMSYCMTALGRLARQAIFSL